VDSGDLPIGRRVAQWRARRRMTQQMLADRLGKSKSWVDKVERGARALDRFSVIQDVAQVLRVDPSVLVGGATRQPTSTGTELSLDDLRAALARYGPHPTGPNSRPLAAGELGRRVEHAWSTYQHAHYPQLVRMLPDLLGDAQRAPGTGGVAGRGPLVQAYRITASLLVKLGEADVAWLAADRAVAVAAGDPLLAAVAAVPLGQALRASGRGRLALAALVAAARRLTPDGPPGVLSLAGTLLAEAGLAAATCGDARRAGELLDRAAALAERVGEGRDDHRTGFGPTSVEVARVAAAVDLGDGGEAVARHETVTRTGGWRLLPVEHRAAHLVDAARAYLQVGDLPAAGRALVEADRTAPAEVRHRPAARTVIAELARSNPAPSTMVHLATTLDPTR
jgi:transcriptional regulator with XRE-family HTH domain